MTRDEYVKQLDSILARELAKASGVDISRVSVLPDEGDEIIRADVDGARYEMQIGSDDDYFFFRSPSRASIRFDYPEDWNSVSEQGYED